MRELSQGPSAEFRLDSACIKSELARGGATNHHEFVFLDPSISLYTMGPWGFHHHSLRVSVMGAIDVLLVIADKAIILLVNAYFTDQIITNRVIRQSVHRLHNHCRQYFLNQVYVSIKLSLYNVLTNLLFESYLLSKMYAGYFSNFFFIVRFITGKNKHCH
jgi:hypothetical protein